MRRVQQGYTPITDFGGKKQVNFDALFSSDSEDEIVVKAAPVPVKAEPEEFPYKKEEFDDPITGWTKKVTESFEKASTKQLSPDFKESLGRLSFFRKPTLVTKEKTSTPSVNTK